MGDNTTSYPNKWKMDPEKRQELPGKAQGKQKQWDCSASFWQRLIKFWVVKYVLVIKSVDGYGILNAVVQFASENTEKKMWRLKFRSSLAFLQVSFLDSELIWEGREAWVQVPADSEQRFSSPVTLN